MRRIRLLRGGGGSIKVFDQLVKMLWLWLGPFEMSYFPVRSELYLGWLGCKSNWPAPFQRL